MRDIGSRNTSGPQAVLCAAVSWWLSGFDLRKVVAAAVANVPVSELWSRDPTVLGSALSPGIPWERVNQSFWDSASEVPAVRHMIEEAVRRWRPLNGLGKVVEAKAFVASVILREAGEIALSSGLLEERSEEIAAARRARGLR